MAELVHSSKRASSGAPSPGPRPTTLQEVEALLSNDTKVKVAGVDVDGVLRGKVMAKNKFLKACKDGFGFCSVIFGWDIHDHAYTQELSISSSANGYKDLLARIDLSSYRRLPWEDDVALFLVHFWDPDSAERICADPRGVLKGVTERLEALGFEAMAGSEYEYFTFAETPQSAAEKKYRDLKPLTPGMHGYSMLRPALNKDWFYEVFDVCTGPLGIPIEGHHTETGPGVFETALEYTNAERMADNAILFKLAAKSLGYKYGIMPTFMAKPHSGLPGTSGHTHVSLRSLGTGRNVFAVTLEEAESGGRKDAQYEDTKYISQQAEWFLAGVLKGLPSVVPLMVPTVNGYKRLVPSFWAPTQVSYGYDDRTSSVRIISPPSCPPEATRFEIRLPGADMNPYFTFASILALGLHGIEQKLPLPFAPQSAEAKRSADIGASLASADGSVDRKLPASLAEATQAMAAKGSLARKALGDAFIDHYAATRAHEAKLYAEAVTDWEMARYFELT